ncbi:MAG: T9SS type A sorting domain-containing protein [Paludibacter sp.]|nr:T9SS type A sorting domain-containing protein [Paludibacter sp.]
MKKNSLKALAICVFCVGSLANYAAVTLPVNYTKFFAVSAVNANGTDLETGAAAAVNTWYLAGTANGASPTISTNDLLYSNYVDNEAGKKMTLLSTITAARTSFYQFTGAAADLPGGGNPYYLSFLINVSTAPAGYVLLTNFINGIASGGTRGRIQLKASATAGNFQIQSLVSGSGSPSIGPLAYNTTHLIVFKYEITTASSPAGTANGAATVTLFANPTIGATEPVSTSTITEFNISNLDCIKALVINQQPFLGAQISGLRFSTNWNDVTLGGGTTTKLIQTQTSKLIIHNNTISSPESGTFEVFNVQGLQVLKTLNAKQINLNLAKGIYMVKFNSANIKSDIRKFVIQ